VPKKCSDSETAIIPVRENSTPTRQTSRSDCFAGRSTFIINHLQRYQASGESRGLLSFRLQIKRLGRALATVRSYGAIGNSRSNSGNSAAVGRDQRM
jgi:hypothetical protein